MWQIIGSKKFAAKSRQHSSHVAEFCVFGLEKASDASVFRIEDSDTSYERFEVRAVERAVYE